MRNRLISGLADALVVVEARERSGSLITAGHALDQGIEVFAVPGPIRAATSLGTNRLLRDGARPLLGVDDVLEALGLGELDGCRGENADVERGGRDPAHPIVASLRDEPADRDELQRRLALTPEQLVLDLLELELEGHIREDRDGRFRVV
jgi:DNA processing protein